MSVIRGGLENGDWRLERLEYSGAVLYLFGPEGLGAEAETERQGDRAARDGTLISWNAGVNNTCTRPLADWGAAGKRCYCQPESRDEQGIVKRVGPGQSRTRACCLVVFACVFEIGAADISAVRYRYGAERGGSTFCFYCFF